MAAPVGFEPTESKVQSLLPYRLAMGQCKYIIALSNNLVNKGYTNLGFMLLLE